MRALLNIGFVEMGQLISNAFIDYLTLILFDKPRKFTIQSF